MGIKGLYRELGPGESIALSKLSLEHFQQTGRPLRIAIDGPIWQFQIQAARGGLNPALRTMYYRLLRLVSLNIQPVFVFDGPNKPPLKRNKPTAPHTVTSLDVQVKQLLDLFGFPHLTAPGEAEAQCALLQRKGLVDIVLSEDVDVLMFGCTRSIRNWGNGSPNHVYLYETEKIRASGAGLDCEGMVLIAMMSGGDYAPAGIPGCGIKTACQAAKAGFGHELCALIQNDMFGVEEWRQRLGRELRTNESGHFQQRHKSLTIPDDFPDAVILGCYINPIVSGADELATLKQNLSWSRDINVTGLRQFVAEALGWDHLSGSRQFIRGLAPALLKQRLRVRAEAGRSNDRDNSNTASNQEVQLVESIDRRRKHASTDHMAELRVSYTPATIVGLDLEFEEAGGNLERNAELSQESSSDSVDDSQSQSFSGPKTQMTPQRYDPTRSHRIWVLESFVKIGVPSTYKKWEDQTQSVGGMRKGALDAFLKPLKPGKDGTAPSSACNPNLVTVSSVPLAIATERVQAGHSKKVHAGRRRATHGTVGKCSQRKCSFGNSGADTFNKSSDAREEIEISQSRH